MKWLITILTTALTTTGCMLESPNPCENSPIGCDVVPYTAPPPKPSQPSVTPTAGTESITISYATSGASYYFVHSSETLPVGVQNQIETTSSTHTFTGLDPNKEYHYTVTAVNDSGISPPSTTVKSQPGVAATTLAVSPTTDTSNTVTWTAVNGADDYIVYMSTATPVTTADTAVNAGTGTSYVHSGLTAGDTWYYMVTPRNEVGAATSAEVSTEVLPQTPGTLSAAPKAEGGAVTLSWTASAGHDGYNILYAAGSQTLAYLQANGSTKAITNTSKVSQNISSLNINQLGSYVIAAYNSAGNSVYSNVVEEQAVPRSPQLQTPDVSKPGKVTLTWIDNNGVNSFKVYRMTGSSGNPETAGTLIATLSGSTMTYTDTGFPAYGGTTYRYSVVPEGGGGVGNIGTRRNAVPTEPAWETIVEDVQIYNTLQVAGTSTGEAFVLGNEWNEPTMDATLRKYNNVAELDYSVILASGTNSQGYDRALALTVAPDGNLMTLMRHTVTNMPSHLTTSGTQLVYVLSKIDQSNGSVMWDVVINPYTDAQWTSVGTYHSFANSKWVGLLADMVVDSSGNAYVAWGSTGASGWVKYDTNGTLTASYDRVADTTGEILGRYSSKPAVVVLPDDSFFWFQHVEKNSTDYLMGSKWASDGSVIFKNRTLDVSRLAYYNHPNWERRSVTNGGIGVGGRGSNSRQGGTAVADAVGNIFVAFTNMTDRVLKFNSEGTYIGGTSDGIDSWMDEFVLATNGQDIYVVSADGAPNMNPKIARFDNTLATKQYNMLTGQNVGFDVYVDPTSCFVYFAGTIDRNWTIPVGPDPLPPYPGRLSRNNKSAGSRNIMLFRTDSDYDLDAASSTCPTPSALPSVNTPVSIAGNGSELGYKVHSGVDGFGEWEMKYSSASTPIEHTVPNVIAMSYGFDSQCVATSTGVQCKGYQGGGLGDSANTTNSASYVSVGTPASYFAPATLASAIDVSVGKDFICALDGSGAPYCWGSNVKGRLGTGNNTTYTTPVASNTSTTFVSIESGAKHTCALTSAGAMECWGSNEEGQMAETVWVNGSGGTKSKKSPDTVFDLGSSTRFSEVSIGPEALFTAALIDNGSIAVWGEYNGTVYTDHFIVNSGVATDVAAGKDHICYLESGAVTCVGDNSAEQTTVPTLTNPTSVHAGADWSCAVMADTTYTCWGSKNGWGGY
tara:strand:- start:389 stop:3934 length:3546 start_codon:yes stop_codon:yes gene_type:complete